MQAPSSGPMLPAPGGLTLDASTFKRTGGAGPVTLPAPGMERGSPI